MEEPALLSQEQVAAQLGVSVRGVQRRTKSGRLAVVFRDAQGAPFYDPEEVARLAQEPQPLTLAPTGQKGQFEAVEALVSLQRQAFEETLRAKDQVIAVLTAELERERSVRIAPPRRWWPWR